MSANLEIPLFVIAKEKKIQTITQNITLIQEALSKIKNVSYEKNADFLKVKLPSFRNKVLVQNINREDKEVLLKFIKER